MRGRWLGGALGVMLLLGACGDPESEPLPVPPPAPRATGTTHQNAAPSPSPSVPPPAPKATGTTHQDAAPSPTPPPTRDLSVVYLGDSLAMENQTVLGEELRRTLGAAYTSAPYSGTTLCDYLEGTGARSLVPDADKAAALVRRERPDVVVLQFWGNAWGYTPCMDGITYDASRERYLDRYAADAARLTEQIAAAGGERRPRIVWVLQGPDPITPERVELVNGLYREQAAATGDALADAGRVVSRAGDRYTWVGQLPCTDYERAHPTYCTEPAKGLTALHRDDDYLHFCLAPTTSTPRPCPVRSPGILRMAQEITRAVGTAR
ncbi:SGNH/GDSL hydrolase family protein [Streptomyces sp. NPDC004610]|uniref:SGNH/GDSL hydrolase family protein n=1 Tax=unclassified Streptomyces TaxID=2593676 RepID=UPI0033B6E490